MQQLYCILISTLQYREYFEDQTYISHFQSFLSLSFMVDGIFFIVSILIFRFIFPLFVYLTSLSPSPPLFSLYPYLSFSIGLFSRSPIYVISDISLPLSLSFSLSPSLVHFMYLCSLELFHLFIYIYASFIQKKNVGSLKN